jgi:hypothetical protein
MLPTEFIYGFLMILRVNRDYFLKLHEQIHLYNVKEACLFCGKE